MTVADDLHEAHGATYERRGGRRVVSHYGRPERTHRAVRNGVGVIEMGYGVVVVTGDDRVTFLDDTVTNRVPSADGAGTYALLLDPDGAVETDMYVYNAGDRLLVFAPPGVVDSLVDDWQSKVFVQDVAVRDATDDFAVFGVHGPTATEKVATVLGGPGAPEPALTFVRGSIRDRGATVTATDAPTGEEGYEVVCAAGDADRVFEELLTGGIPAVPFGYRTWETLTVEAGTPLFETELDGRVPNVLGVRNAVDFEKGCFVGQEVVSRVENRGRPSRRLVGLRPERLPPAGAAVLDGDREVGTVTRAVESPTLETPVALALVAYALDATDLAVRVDAASVPAPRVALPFVEGSARSARCPRYPAETA